MGQGSAASGLAVGSTRKCTMSILRLLKLQRFDTNIMANRAIGILSRSTWVLTF